jgi:RHS repeat-associated protein
MTQYTSTVTLDGIGTYTSTFDKAAMKQVNSSPSGRVATKLFDSKGQLIESRIGNLEPEKYTYNLKGQLTRITQGTRVKRFTYNGRGLLATVTNPLGEVERFTYNLNGLITSHTLANGDVYQFTYNPNNRLRSVKMPDERVYTQSYNVNSYPATFREPMIDESEYLWRTNYNFDNDITRYRLPDQSLISWVYDSQGRVSSQVGPGFQKTFGYTSIGLINSIQWSPADRLLIDGNSEHLRSVIWEGETKGKVSYTWAPFSRLSGLRINDKFAGGFTYTKEGELSTVLTANATLSLIRTPDTGLLSASRIGSITTEQGYNLFGELTNLTTKIGSTSLASYTYTRDNLGRITEITSPTGSRAFSYDAKGQLISATENGATKSFSYTRNGNRLTANGQEVYDSQERLISDAYWTYTYGRNGQLQRKDHKVNGSSAQYIYDAAGNLLSVKTADGTLIEYKSDGLDRRISRRVNGQFNYGLLYQDNLRPLAQVDQSGIVIASFIYGSRSNSPDLMTKDGITYRFIHDHLGSIIFVLNSTSNQVAQALTYDVWGNVVSDSNPGFQPFGFAGGIYDPTTGLLRFGARDYDPSIGRWLNKDPIRFAGGSNFYVYVKNDPINFVDPSGQVGIPGIIVGAISGGVGAAITSGGDLQAIAIGAVIGGVVGAFNPLASLAHADIGITATQALINYAGNMAFAGVASTAGQVTGNIVTDKPWMENFSVGAVVGAMAGAGASNFMNTGLLGTHCGPVTQGTFEGVWGGAGEWFGQTLEKAYSK